MDMLSNSPTIEALARAIDVSALRQSVHATNIANAGVDGYRRMEVMFHREAQRMALQMSAGSHSVNAAAEQPRATIIPTSATVKLDEEVAQMATNALRYQTLLGAFERTMNLMRTAIREGRE